MHIIEHEGISFEHEGETYHPKMLAKTDITKEELMRSLLKGIENFPVQIHYMDCGEVHGAIAIPK